MNVAKIVSCIQVPRALRGVGFLLLASCFSFAALIKSPIPPAAEGHFVRDADGDGVADQIAIRFLNPVDTAYLKGSVDSITVSDNFILANATPKNNMLFLEVVGRGNVTGGVSATLYQKNAAPVKLTLADSLAPIPVSASVVAGNGMNGDTLVVTFSEPVELGDGSLKLFAKNGSEKELNYREFSGAVSNNLKYVLDRKTAENLAHTDSILVSAAAAVDGLKNKSRAKKLSLDGISAFKIVVNSQAKFAPTSLNALPVFESNFAPLGSEFPKDRLGMAFDFGGSQFVETLNEILKDKGLERASLEDLSLRMDLSVYSQSGEYLTNSHLDVNGNDSKLSGGSRVFFLWNFMDGHRRVVGSGVYLVRTTLQIFYRGKLVVKDDVGTLHSFGALRR